MQIQKIIIYDFAKRIRPKRCDKISLEGVNNKRRQDCRDVTKCVKSSIEIKEAIKDHRENEGRTEERFQGHV